MIKGQCYSNLDDFQRRTWPSCFVEVPRVGDYIEATDGFILKIIRITHCMPKDSFGQPTIKIELYK